MHARDNAICELLRREVSSIQNPKNTSDVYEFPHIDELAEVLVAFLEFDCNEPLVAQVGQKVGNVLSAWASGKLDNKTLPSAIEDLSTGFESFLKKIAVIRYAGDNLRIHGDGIRYKGLLSTSLGKLLEGKVEKVRDAKVSDLSAPLVTFSTTYPYHLVNIPETVYGHVHVLRNEVHVAPEHTTAELWRDLTLAAAAYLFALEENLLLIRKRIDPVFIYLASIRENKDFQKWETSYVELLGEEKQNTLLDDWPDLQALEWRDEAEDNVGAPLPWEKEIAKADFSAASMPPLSAPILGLSENQPRLWLIGEPGAGKTTTLQRLAWSRADELLKSGYLTQSIPVLISANLVDSQHSPLKIASELTKLDLAQVNRLMSSGKLWLMIDAINEMASTEQERARRELQHLLLEFDKAPVLLTSRKYGFKDFLDIPVFEVLPLSDEMIHEYLVRNLLTEAEADRLFDQLRASESLLLDLARSPLMLWMLTHVVRDGKFPTNRGQLFKQFMGVIFRRERKTKQTDARVKEKCLAEIAFQTRRMGQTAAHEVQVLEWIKSILQEMHYPIGPIELLTELLDNHILELDINKKVAFFHELVLEYFAAVKLCESYILQPQATQSYLQEGKWFESIVMLSGLLENADELVTQASRANMVLAARCIGSGARVSEEAKLGVVRTCAQTLTQDRKIRVDAAAALLEMGTDDALRPLVDLLSNENESFPLTESLSRCSRPEITALRLLKFGLTGRQRIYQCLRVFRDKVVSRAVIDSPEVTRAQMLLLDHSVEVRYIELVNSMGVSSGIATWFADRVMSLLNTTSTASALWRSVFHAAIGHLPTETVIRVVNERIEESDSLTTGETFYSLLYACQCLSRSSEQSVSDDIAIRVARLCLKQGLFGLTTKFTELFDISDKLSDDDLDMGSVQKVALDGSIAALIGLSRIFPQTNFEQYLEVAVDSQLAKNNLQIIMQYADELAPVLAEKAEIARKTLLATAPKMKAKTIEACVRTFHLEDVFRNSGKLNSYNSAKRFGFIQDLSTSEILFFAGSAIVRILGWHEPEIGQIVYFGEVRPAAMPDQRRFVAMVLVDLYALENEGLDSLAAKGQLSTLIKIAQILQCRDLSVHIEKAIKYLLKRGNLAIVLQHKTYLRSAFQDKADIIKSAIVRTSSNMSFHDLSTCITALELQGVFANCAQIINCFTVARYGFATDIQSKEVLLFRFSSVETAGARTQLRVGRIIRYDKAMVTDRRCREAMEITVL
jgi:hypothetical protein